MPHSGGKAGCGRRSPLRRRGGSWGHGGRLGVADGGVIGGRAGTIGDHCGRFRRFGGRIEGAGLGDRGCRFGIGCSGEGSRPSRAYVIDGGLVVPDSDEDKDAALGCLCVLDTEEDDGEGGAARLAEMGGEMAATGGDAKDGGGGAKASGGGVVVAAGEVDADGSGVVTVACEMEVASRDLISVGSDLADVDVIGGQGDDFDNNEGADPVGHQLAAHVDEVYRSVFFSMMKIILPDYFNCR
ncbi:hypothetical protein ACP4OV_013147 [Aristida adscensionis]